VGSWTIEVTKLSSTWKQNRGSNSFKKKTNYIIALKNARFPKTTKARLT